MNTCFENIQVATRVEYYIVDINGVRIATI